MRLRAALQALGALCVCGATGFGILYVTNSAAQSAKQGQVQAEANANVNANANANASPIYGVTSPPGYRDWRLIAVKQLAGA